MQKDTLWHNESNKNDCSQSFAQGKISVEDMKIDLKRCNFAVYFCHREKIQVQN